MGGASKLSVCGLVALYMMRRDAIAATQIARDEAQLAFWFRYSYRNVVHNAAEVTPKNNQPCIHPDQPRGAPLITHHEEGFLGSERYFHML
jgi:hypothetical protein